jgi:hypothetical protein
VLHKDDLVGTLVERLSAVRGTARA